MKKRLLTLLWLLCPLLFAAGVFADKTVYLKPSSNWKNDGARFALYMYGNGESWDSFVAVEGETNLYKATFKDGYTNMIICRMNGSTTTNSWDNKWNQTGDLPAPTADNLVYTLTDGTWDGEGTNTIKIEAYGGGVVPDATISTMRLTGDIFSWGDGEDFAVVEANKTYTYELNLTDNTNDVLLKLRPNGSWVGYGAITLDAPTGWTVGEDDGSGGENIKLLNSTTGYQKYLLTATWEENPSATDGWTLKVEGTEERPTPTYTAKFTNDGKWTTVYAYLYNNDGTVGTEWPGTAIEKNGDTWDFSAQLTSAPTHIIFNAGNNCPQTEDLEFTEGQTYSYTVPKYTICGYDKFYGGWGATEGKDVNVMTLGDDGKFTWTKTDVEVKSSDLEQQFRLQVNNAYTKEGFYNVAGFNGNISNTLPKAGTYDVTVTFDQNTMTVSAEYTRHTVPAKDYTVTLVNSAAWSTVNAYAWSGDGDTAIKKSGEWPGSTATKSDAKVGTFDTYTYTFENMEEDDVPEKIIWNDGTNQTADLTFEDGATYWNETVYGLEGTAFGGWKDGSQYRGIENILTKTGEGIYTYTVSGVKLKGGTAYPYHVSVNGAWASLGIGGVDGNKEFRPEEDGEYTITITLNTNPDVKSVEATLIKTDAIVEPTSVQFFQITPSQSTENFQKSESGYVYTYEWDLTETTQNQDFLLLVNGGGDESNDWAGYLGYKWVGNTLTLDAPNGWLESKGSVDVDGQNIVLKNSTTGYKTYTITATWTPSNNPFAGWTLKVEGKDERPATSTYNATFVNTPGWENVYAYVFANDAPIDNVEWPGVKLTAGDADTYSYSAELTTSPQYIIFNNGVTDEGADQTDNLTWENGKQYTVAVEYINLLGDMNNWDTTTEALFTKSPDAENTWIIEDIDLSSTTEDQEFKLFVNDNWLGFNDITINAPEGWLVDDGTDNHDIKFMNSITGFKTYSLTATWTPNGKINKGWTLTMTGKEQRETEINAPTSVQIPGDWNGWDTEDLTATINESGNYVYTTEVDLTTYTENPSFKLKINNGGDATDNWGGWLGWAAMESGALIVDRPDGWVYEKEGDGNRDLMLANSISGYQKYQFTATWVPSNNPYTGWTLKIEGTEERQAVADTYTYYVVGNETLTGVNWDKDDANKFIENEGAYTLTKEGVEINKGEYTYKVVAVNDNTGAWTWMPEGMDNDDIVNIPSNGKYNITWTLDIDAIGTTDYPYSYELEEVDMVYSVVGASPGVWYPEEDPIFGHAWLSNEASNDMTLDDTATVPTYTWKKQNVELNAGNIEMKVIKNHLYGDQGGAEWPSHNKVLTVEAGTYNIAISFVPSTGEVTITAEPVSQEEKDKYVYYVDMQNWTPSAHIWNNDGDLTPDWTQGVADHTLNAFGNEYSVSKYEFAGEPTNIMFRGADDSQKTSDMPFVNGATYGNDGDAANGVFIFSDDENQFKPEQNVNVNGNAKYVRQFTVGEPCTVVLPFALGADKVGDNAEAGQVGVFYRITAIAEGQINGNTEVPGAYTPYVFIPAVEYPFTYVGFGQLPAVPETKNYALNGGDVVFEWVTTATTVTSDNEWTYYGWDKSTHKFVKAAVGQANPFRSYIKIKTDKLGSMGLSAKESIDLSFINGGEATAISALRAAIADGEATVFDLQGRKVDNPTMRGVYIVNGKKYVVK